MSSSCNNRYIVYVYSWTIKQTLDGLCVRKPVSRRLSSLTILPSLQVGNARVDEAARIKIAHRIHTIPWFNKERTNEIFVERMLEFAILIPLKVQLYILGSGPTDPIVSQNSRSKHSPSLNPKTEHGPVQFL